MSSPMMSTRGSRSISSIIASRMASRKLFSAIAHHVVVQLIALRRRTLLGEFQRLRHFLVRPGLHFLDVFVRQPADLGEAIAEDENRIAVLVLLARSEE